MPDPLDYNVQIAGAFAAATKSVAAALFQIPNQPLKFSDDPLDKRRSEDAIIGNIFSDLFDYHQTWIGYFKVIPGGNGLTIPILILNGWFTCL